MAKLILTLSIVAFFLWGCASSPPTELKTARTAVAKAYAAGAPRYAPAAYRVAQAALNHGENLVDQGEIDQAKVALSIAETKAHQALFRTRKEKRDAQLERASQSAEEAAMAFEEKRAETARTASPNAKLPPPAHKGAGTASLPLSSKLAPRPSPPSPRQVVKYTVSEGETLWTIAARKDVYLDALLWPLIYKANRDQIKDPRQIYPGQVLNIPRDVSQVEIENAREMARKSTVFPLELLMKAEGIKK